MIFLLIIGLTLLAASVFMIVRAAYGPRTGTTSATIQSIGAYGFSGSETVDKSSGKRPLSELATSIGNRLRGTRLSKGEVETRNMLVSAGMYSTSPDRFLGFQVISTVVIGLFTLWLLGISGMSVFWVIVALGLRGRRRLDASRRIRRSARFGCATIRSSTSCPT